MKEFILISILIFSICLKSKAQERYKAGMSIHCPVCYASDKLEKSRIPPPAEFLLKSGTSKSQIIVDYKGFSDEAKRAFAYAVKIWESIIESDMPIRMEAVWSNSLSSNVLGNCGPETYYSNFKNAPEKNRYYAVAIAEKISKEELNGESRYDISANFNKNINWYFGLDMNTPDDKYDFVSVVLHEIGHGLGFTGFFSVENSIGSYSYNKMGDASSFDLLVQNVAGKELVNPSFFENASVPLKKALEGLVMYSNSPVAKARNEGLKPRLYAPTEFSGGSSVYHLNDNTYPHGNENSLMTHAVGRGEAIHDPGPLVRGILDDIGWRNLFIHFEPIKDKEQLEEITFTVSLESDYKIDSSKLFVIYSNDGFQSHTDKLPLKAFGKGNMLRATLTPSVKDELITYYITAADTLSRVRTLPSSVPEDYFTIKFGTDTEKPVITHTPIPYFLKIDKPLELVVKASDNVGVDTVFVQYLLNGIEQPPFGLKYKGEDIYHSVFPVEMQNLRDGDRVEYTLFAKDLSQARNSSQLPVEGKRFSFLVEEVFEPISAYSYNFNKKNHDFVISDFDIYTSEGFDNGALHSPHPYLSPKIDNKEFNFSAFLKYPIVIKESGTMTFDEVVLVEPKDEGAVYGDNNFWDYVVVEASKDTGKTWLPLTDGYDAAENVKWKEKYNERVIDQVSQAKGNKEWFVTREIDLLHNGNFISGDTILIRFRLYSDPYASGWGWAIDNLYIQRMVSVPVTILSPGNVRVFPNPVNNLVKIKIGAIKTAVDIQINVYDIFGRKVYTQLEKAIYGAFSTSINMQHFPNGLYLIQINENNKRLFSKKLIKE